MSGPIERDNPQLKRAFVANATATAFAVTQGLGSAPAGAISLAGQRGVPLILPFGIGAEDTTAIVRVGLSFRIAGNDQYLNVGIADLTFALGTYRGSEAATSGGLLDTERLAKTVTPATTSGGWLAYINGLYGSSAIGVAGTAAGYAIPDVAGAHLLWFDADRDGAAGTAATSINVLYQVAS